MLAAEPARRRLRIDVVELGGSDEGIDRGCTLALIGAGEGPVSSSYSDRS